MKNKVFSVIFTAACLIICIIPFAGMAVVPSNEAVGNEKQKSLPSITDENGAFNKEYFQQLGDYFSTHYALRPQIISSDAEIQSKLFGTSNLNSVVVGKNDWLYYSSTLDNALGRNLMSDRAIFNTRNNLELTQDYLKESGIQFLFTVAPNKNTLYPENLPYYYSKRESEESNINRFTASLNNSRLNYCDLFTPLKSQNEVVYFKQDSHWNNKGALIAYNEILNSVGKAHDDYSDAKASRIKNFYGDLGKMLYPSTQQPEYNYEYDISKAYSYVTPTKSVEDALIETKNDSATGRLYMYRDSFGNALLPYLANAYNSAYFKKAFPINLAFEVGIQKSDTVIFEIAERNLMWFAQSPPVLPAKELSVPKADRTVDNDYSVKAEISQVNMQYLSVSGCMDSDLCSENSEFIVLIKDKDGKNRAFKAFTTSDKESDYCFQAYIPAEYTSQDNIDVSVIIKNGNEYIAEKENNAVIQQPDLD